MANKYYCEKCKRRHTMNSDIGKRHRGIKVEKPKRYTFEIILPDKTTYKTTSIFKFKYAVLRLTKKWYVDLYINKEKANHRVKWFKEPHQTNIKKVKLIELDQKTFKKY